MPFTALGGIVRGCNCDCDVRGRLRGQGDRVGAGFPFVYGQTRW